MTAFEIGNKRQDAWNNGGREAAGEQAAEVEGRKIV